jgi:uncharacterized SAM-binding protein YcdF (DUF218 family)
MNDKPVWINSSPIAGRFFPLSFCVLICLFGLNACSFSRASAKRLLTESKSQIFDMVIVPGVPFENGKWSRTMKGRVYWSKYLYDLGIAKNIMYSGSSVYSPYYEGEIMALYAEALGIPRENLYTETRAEHSTENIYYSYKKARKLGFNKIALASDPFQTRSLKKFTQKKVSPAISFIPMVHDTMISLKPKMINPPVDYQKAYNKEFRSILKRESFWKRFRGSMGKNVDSLVYR